MMKTWFIQSLHIFPDEFLVMVGYSHAEAVKVMKRIGVKKGLIEYVEHSDGIKATFDQSAGGCFGYDGARMLWLRDWEANSITHYSRLVHETSHLVDFILIEGRNMAGETEGLAYAQDYMFTQLVTKLNKQYESKKTRKRQKGVISKGKTKTTRKRRGNSNTSSRRKK